MKPKKHLQRAIHAFYEDTAKMPEVFSDKPLYTHQDSQKLACSFASSENAELGRPFQLHDFKAALAKMKRGTAQGRDKVTVTLLDNLVDPTYARLLEYFNAISDGGAPLPVDWKTALVMFVPEPCKAISIDNLRPISLASCVGKLMETVFRDLLSNYLDIQNTLADTLYGFRPHRSAQDVLLQLHREILDTVEHLSNYNVVLALDLKEVFHNVTHEIILAHLSQTDCGYNTFRYIRRFLPDRQPYSRRQHFEHGPYQLGTRGTPQGAVLSPLLFNMAMVTLATLLSAVPGVQHTLYADAITLWAKHGFGRRHRDKPAASGIY